MTVGHLLGILAGMAFGFCCGALWAWKLARDYYAAVFVMMQPGLPEAVKVTRRAMETLEQAKLN